jgi:hypothetical protein
VDDGHSQNAGPDLVATTVKGITTYEREEKSLRSLAKQVLQPVED